MKIIQNILNRIDISTLKGDVVSLHKGRLRVLRNNKKLLKPNPRKTELREAISKGHFSIKLSLLPDVSQTKIVLQSYNYLLALVGIQTRYGSHKTLIKARNGRINRYLIYMYHRLLQAKLGQKTTLYWRIFQTLLSRSHGYLSAILFNQTKRLFKTRPLEKDLHRIIKSVNRLRGAHVGQNSLRHLNRTFYQSSAEERVKKTTSLLQLTLARHRMSAHVESAIMEALLEIPAFGPSTVMDSQILYKRVYQDKNPLGSNVVGNQTGTYRPLGVPSLAWRTFTSMWILGLNGAYDVDRNQHGFIPKRGTLTAWKQVAHEVLNSRNIYEIDFKGYFPSISAPYVSSMLYYQSGVPGDITTFLTEMGKVPPVLESLNRAKLPEINAYTKHEELYWQKFERSMTKYGKLTKEFQDYPSWMVKNEETEELYNLLENSITFLPETHIGLPQGSSLSPFLSVIFFNEA
jgi:hypothetical protein